MAPMSMAPDEAVEGGDFPKGDLLVVRAWFGEHAYMKLGKPVKNKDGSPSSAVVAFLDLRNDDGRVFHQFYSLGDPARFTISSDAKVIEDGVLKTNCNFYQLLVALTNAGYPADKLRESADIEANLVGLYADFDQETERRGDSSLLVLPIGPTGLHQFPWGAAVKGAPEAPDVEEYEKEEDAPAKAEAPKGSAKKPAAKAGAKTAAKPAAPTAAETSDEHKAAVIEATKEFLNDESTEGKRTRADLSMFIFNSVDGDDKMPMMSAVMAMTDDDYAAEDSGLILEGEELSQLPF